VGVVEKGRLQGGRRAEETLEEWEEERVDLGAKIFGGKDRDNVQEEQEEVDHCVLLSEFTG
jgi:predicted NAD/FAD-dependent oxidoreductase